LFAYFPQIDYSAQKYGISSSEVTGDLQKIDESIGRIINAVKSAGIYDDTEFLLISEYGFNDVNDAIPINRILREKDLLKVRTIKGKEYIDFEYSLAFAMVDHQVAHIYLNKEGKEMIEKIKKTLQDISGIETVCDADEKRNLYIDHQRSGDLIIIAQKDKWFSYYWWFEEDNNNPSETSKPSSDRDKAPTFTKTVDIHRKPGYDPLDLFFDPVKKSISTNTSLIKGSHGRPYNVETKEGLSAFVSSKKISKSGQGVLDGLPIINCLDIFGLLSNRFKGI
jgi:predicted AlkP superfamily pyrophosphatase or phosphodiesterase